MKELNNQLEAKMAEMKVEMQGLKNQVSKYEGLNKDLLVRIEHMAPLVDKFNEISTADSSI